MRKVTDPKLIPLLERMVNKLINGFLKKNTNVEDEFNFTVGVRRALDKPFTGYNAGSYGEPYNYIIEINSDIPIPSSFTYKDDTKSKFDISKFQYEIKKMLPLLGIDNESLGNVVGVFFSNVKD